MARVGLFWFTGDKWDSSREHLVQVYSLSHFLEETIIRVFSCQTADADKNKDMWKIVGNDGHNGLKGHDVPWWAMVGHVGSLCAMVYCIVPCWLPAGLGQVW